MERAGVAKPADAGLLKSSPPGGPGSSPGARTTYVRIGDRVQIEDEDETAWWTIAGPDDARERGAGEMSWAAPLAHAVLGRRVGDEPLVRGPGPVESWRRVKILALEPASRD